MGKDLEYKGGTTEKDGRGGWGGGGGVRSEKSRHGETKQGKSKQVRGSLCATSLCVFTGDRGDHERPSTSLLDWTTSVLRVSRLWYSVESHMQDILLQRLKRAVFFF